MFGSSLIPYIPGNITEMTGKTVNLLTVPIFCLFFFALFVKRSSPVGVWIGWFCGTTVAILVAFSGPIFGFIETEDGPVDPVSGGTVVLQVDGSGVRVTHTLNRCRKGTTGSRRTCAC